MPFENEIIESIGELKGLMKAASNDIKILNDKQDNQNESIKTITTALAVMTNNCSNNIYNCTSKFGEINNKLARDYDRLNIIEKDRTAAAGVADYKSKTKSKITWFLVTLSTIVGLLISANQLMNISSKISYKETRSVYADTLRIHGDK